MANTVHPVTAYAEAVVAGDILAGKLIHLACERHLRDLATGHERGLWFDEAAADDALTFFGFLPHIKGEWAGKDEHGQLRTLTLEPWQQFIIGSLFGWKRADGTRRFRTAYVEVPRKNAKSTLSAGIGLYLAFFDNEPGAEVYAAATKRDQAKIVWGDAKQMVLKQPALRRRVTALVGNLNDPATTSKFEPLGGDGDNQDGLNIHGAVIDELHAHKTRTMVDVIDTATGARRQPLIVEITTAGFDRESVCWQHHEYTRQVVEGTVEDDSWFGTIYSIDKDDDWADESAWAKANPNLGVSVKIDDLRRKCKRAKEIPAEQNPFKRLHLDVWTDQATLWMDLDKWDTCAGLVAWQELPETLAGRACYAGLDLASTTDIAALVLVFPNDDDPTGFDLVPCFWVPEATLVERTQKGNVPYLTWVEQGLIEATPGDVIDYGAIMARFDQAAQDYDIREVGYDRWGSTQLIQDMQTAGLTVVPIGQGFASMSAPTKELQTLVLTRRLRHGGHPVLRWMASNMVVDQDAAGNLKPAKHKSSGKIDGIVAAIMGIDRATRQENPTSKYETEDLLIL